MYKKDESSNESISFNFALVESDGKNIVDESIKVVGKDANLLEIMEWYLKEKSIEFVHDNGFVTQIADLQSDASNGWLFYVNDEMSEVGAADYIPKDGDKVEWRYLDYSKMEFNSK